MSEQRTVAFSDLVGEHVLTGVSSVEVRVEGDVADSITFVLDGVAYTAQEDPSDGYRSYLGALYIGGECANTFPPVRVLAREVGRRENDYGSREVELLELVDAVTGEIVLEVGTDNSDDYYPSFVASFRPQHMAINVQGTP